MSFISREIIYKIKMLDQRIQIEINELIEYTKGELVRDDKYKLFYMIQENFKMNLYSFESTILENDYFGFMTAKRNTRSSIETYLDLYNWIKDSRYIEVMRYNSKDEEELKNNSEEEIDLNNDNFIKLIDEYRIGRYQNVLKYRIDMADKRRISMILGQGEYALKKFKSLTAEYNKYVHPNIFIGSNKSEGSLKELIIVNIEIYASSYRSLSKYINSEDEDIILKEMVSLVDYIKQNSVI